MEAAGAPMLHLDVGDGHFSPEVRFGQPMVESLSKATALPLDVHLQIERPERYAEEFVHLGARRLAVHVEAAKDLFRLLSSIRRAGAKAGVALRPETPWCAVSEALHAADYVILLATRCEEDASPALAKIREADLWRREERRQLEICVEGGIGKASARQIGRAGADILIAGNAIFQSSDPAGQLKELAKQVAPASKSSGSKQRNR